LQNLSLIAARTGTSQGVYQQKSSHQTNYPIILTHGITILFSQKERQKAMPHSRLLKIK